MKPAKGNQSDGQRERQDPVGAPAQRTQDVAAVQLRHGHEIQRSNKQSHPCGAADGRQEQRVGRNPPMKNRFEKVQQERRSINQFCVRRISKSGHQPSMHHAINERRDGEDETDDGSRGADVKQRTIGAHWRTNQDERAKRAGEVGKGNKKRIGGMEVMVAASKEMSQFMSQKDPEQRRRKRKSRQKS